MTVRPRVVALVAAGVLIGAGGALVLRPRPAARTTAVTAPPVTVTVRAPAAQTRPTTTSVPSTTTVDAAPDAVARARAAAQAFFAGYLPFLYGQAELTEVVSVSPALRRALEHRRDVPASLRDRDPRLTGLTAQAQAATSVLVTATVDDGAVAPFRLLAHVERQPDGRWLVSELADD